MEINLPSRDEYVRENWNVFESDYIPAYKCPECGETVYRNNNVMICTYPPRHEYICKSCGYCETLWDCYVNVR